MAVTAPGCDIFSRLKDHPASSRFGQLARCGNFFPYMYYPVKRLGGIYVYDAYVYTLDMLR